jgi:predicted component of type VI protein secretion system
VILEWDLNGQKQQYWLAQGITMTIGRGSDCAITISHPTVSRHHGEIFSRGAAFSIRNLSLSNPIFVEQYGSRMRLGQGQEAALPVGDRLCLGEVRVQLREATTMRVRCPGPCGKVVEVPPSGFCPHCGMALATAETFSG